MRRSDEGNPRPDYVGIHRDDPRNQSKAAPRPTDAPGASNYACASNRVVARHVASMPFLCYLCDSSDF